MSTYGSCQIYHPSIDALSFLVCPHVCADVLDVFGVSRGVSDHSADFYLPKNLSKHLPYGLVVRFSVTIFSHEKNLYCGCTVQRSLPLYP